MKKSKNSLALRNFVAINMTSIVGRNIIFQNTTAKYIRLLVDIARDYPDFSILDPEDVIPLLSDENPEMARDLSLYSGLHYADNIVSNLAIANMYNSMETYLKDLLEDIIIFRRTILISEDDKGSKSLTFSEWARIQEDSADPERAIIASFVKKELSSQPMESFLKFCGNKGIISGFTLSDKQKRFLDSQRDFRHFMTHGTRSSEPSGMQKNKLGRNDRSPEETRKALALNLVKVLDIYVRIMLDIEESIASVYKDENAFQVDKQDILDQLNSIQEEIMMQFDLTLES